MGDKVTVPLVRARKQGPKLTMITAYDYPSAMIASEAGVDMILVGDSVANVIHGMDDTLGVDIDIMVLHSQAVKRAKPNPLLVVDMPWLSFHISREDTLRNAGRLVREGGAEAVKLEGGIKRVPMVEALVGAEIPVLGHLGLTPQSVHAMGGYKVQGRELEAARHLIQEAKELEAAGVFAIVLEGVPDLVGKMVTEQVAVPTIGIGAGPHTDGQVLVYTDLLGLGFGRYPKFVRRY
ncbi:MAG TPA: 3-methyl-2-oxobutanoate hydroxymethyltransferase, partial [Acidimicrobiia bacterium]|nr:3-methyl-2-oxobutanoate hydroxymethyltransferase [Acidimicrobiia bacterium]